MSMNDLNSDAVQRILDAISAVNVTLARVEARIDSLMRDTKDHEGRIRVLEHDQTDVKLLKADIDANKLTLEKLTDMAEKNADEIDVLESDRDSVRGFMRAVAIITPAVSGIISFGVMILVKFWAG